jgi:hypothetical protein
VIGSGVVIGASGSHNDVGLRLKFGDMWVGLNIYATFTDANGEGSAVVMLMPSMLDDGEEMTYLLPIPAEAKKYPGKAMLTLSGYSKINGTQVDKATNTVTAFFRVLKSNYRLLTDSSVTPTLAQQLHSEVNNLGERIEENEMLTANNAENIANLKDNVDSLYGASGSVVIKSTAWSGALASIKINGIGAHDMIIFFPATEADRALLNKYSIFINPVVTDGIVKMTAKITPTESITLVYFIGRGA